MGRSWIAPGALLAFLLFVLAVRTLPTVTLSLALCNAAELLVSLSLAPARRLPCGVVRDFEVAVADGSDSLRPRDSLAATLRGPARGVLFPRAATDSVAPGAAPLEDGSL